MDPKWRCSRCGHEVVETPVAAAWATAIPRCYKCATFELVVPGTPKMLCPLPMEEVREAA